MRTAHYTGRAWTAAVFDGPAAPDRGLSRLLRRLVKAIGRPWPSRGEADLSVWISPLGGDMQDHVVAMIRFAATQSGSAAARASAARASDPEGFDETVLCYLDAAYNLARFLTRDGVAAEDLVQEAMLKAYRGFPAFRGGDSKAWLLTIVRREVADWANARRRSGQVFCEVQGDIVEDVHAAGEGPEEAAIKRDQLHAVRRAIYALPEAYRETVVLRDVEDLSYKEIAQVTGVSLGTVMSRLARGRELLTHQLLAEARAAPSGPESER